MGRNIPSVTAQLETVYQRWRGFSRVLPTQSRDAYEQLMTGAKNYRASITEMDEPDVTVPILLAMVVQLKKELEQIKDESQDLWRQYDKRNHPTED